MKGRDMNKIVPIEPTEEMIRELMHEWDSVGATSMYDNYDAMLKVLPESDHIIVSKAEYEQMKADAERYRHLEEMYLGRDSNVEHYQYAKCIIYFICDDVKDNLRESVREAIDKAKCLTNN